MRLRGMGGAGLLLLSLLVAASTSWAQAYPDKPIRLIVADATGGAPDTLARLLSQKLSERLGQQVVVDNRPGAAGQLGAEFVARSAPDGHTLLLNTTALWAILPSVRKSLPYDAAKAFAPITRIATASNVLVVNPSLAVTTVPQLVTLAKARPGKISYASAGIATPAHLAGEMLGLLAGITMTHVAYKGAGPALLDVLSGTVDMMITSPVAAGAHIRSGKLRAVATSGSQRSRAMPDLPTIAESLPDYEITQSWGVAAPAGTPPEILRRLHEEISRAMGLPEMRERVEALGAVPLTETPQEFERFIEAERRRLAEVISKSGIALTN